MKKQMTVTEVTKAAKAALLEFNTARNKFMAALEQVSQLQPVQHLKSRLAKGVGPAIISEILSDQADRTVVDGTGQKLTGKMLSRAKLEKALRQRMPTNWSDQAMERAINANGPYNNKYLHQFFVKGTEMLMLVDERFLYEKAS